MPAIFWIRGALRPHSWPSALQTLAALGPAHVSASSIHLCGARVVASNQAPRQQRAPLLSPVLLPPPARQRCALPTAAARRRQPGRSARQSSAMQDLKDKAAELQDKLSDLHAEFSQSAAKQVGCLYAQRPGSALEDGITFPRRNLSRLNFLLLHAIVIAIIPPLLCLQADPPAAAQWQQQWEEQVNQCQSNWITCRTLACSCWQITFMQHL